MPLPGSSIIHPHLHRHITGWRRRGLPDRCTIHRANPGPPVLDAVTGHLTPLPPTLIHVGSCTVQPSPYGERMVVIGDDQVVLRKYVVSIDNLAPAVDIDDVLTVTHSESASLVDRPLVVVDIAFDTFESRRLLICEDRSGMNP